MFIKLFKKIRMIFCHHDKGSVFVRNIHGDEINLLGGYRSEWKCEKCGRKLYSFYLNRHYSQY